MLALLLALLTGGAAHAAASGPVRSAHSEARLVPELDAVEPGADLRVGLWIRLDPGWHTYWKNPGDSGSAAILKWDSRELEFGEPLWPAPERIEVGPLVNYGYERELFLTVPARAVPGARGRVRAELDAEWLVCRVECVPARARLSLRLPVRAGRPDPVWRGSFPRAEASLPRPPAGWRIDAARESGFLRLRAEPPPGQAVPEAAEFFPSEPLVLAGARQRFSRDERALSLSLPLAEEAEGPPRRLSGVLAFGGSGLEVDVPVAESSASFGAALALAFLGGMLLNLMPCVFPVLSIKVLSFLEHSGGRPRRHAAAYAAGVLTSFWALAAELLILRRAGAEIGWGFQLQHPAFLGALAALFVALGLNLLGAFELGLGLTRLGGLAGGSGYRGTFLSGALAVIVATPCTAPFMGAALGAAVAMPPAAGMAVFTALALGMSLPYVGLACFPAGLRLLPRAGPWMATLKQALAWPLFATAAWLLWVLGRQAKLPWLGALAAWGCGAGVLAWVWIRWPRPRARAAAAALAAGAALWALYPSPQPLSWEPWSEEAVESHLAAGRRVFVDFTADWCVTCQVNERVALRDPAAVRALNAPGIARLKADWTSKDERITRALEGLGRSGVPVYALYAPGRPPELLPAVLTPGTVVEALERNR